MGSPECCNQYLVVSFLRLARERNSNYIKDELVVSRNTVKAHVKHIYQKLNIHTHQKIIDMVEGALLD